MTSNDQHPGADQPTEPIPDDTQQVDPSAAPAPSAAVTPAPVDYAQTLPLPSLPGAGFPPPGQPAAYLPPAAAPTAGWGAPPSQPFPAPGQPYPTPPYASTPAAGGLPGTGYGPPAAYPAPGQGFAGQTPTSAAYSFPGVGQPPGGGKKGSKVPLFIGLGVLVVVLVATAGVFGLRALNSATPGHSSSAKDAVQGYLQALAAGNSGAALEYAQTAPFSTVLLTDEVLRSSIARAPITDISVKDAAGSSLAVVSASYQLGDTPVTATFRTTKVNGEWRLTDVAKELDLTGVDGLSLTLNGIAIDNQSSITVFPGSYLLASGNDRIALDGGDFMIKSTMDYTTPMLTSALSDKGLADVRAAAQQKLAACIKSTKLAPSGCGFRVRATGVAVKTVKWRVTTGANELKNADFNLDFARKDSAEAYVSVQLGITVHDTLGQLYTGSATIRKATADLSGTDVAITFS